MELSYVLEFTFILLETVIYDFSFCLYLPAGTNNKGLKQKC